MKLTGHLGDENNCDENEITTIITPKDSVINKYFGGYKNVIKP